MKISYVRKGTNARLSGKKNLTSPKCDLKPVVITVKKTKKEKKKKPPEGSSVAFVNVLERDTLMQEVVDNRQITAHELVNQRVV